MGHRLVAVGSLFLDISAFVGCRDDGKFRVDSTAGSVTYRGQPAAGAKVIFVARDDSLRQPGIPVLTGVVGDDGTIVLTTYEVGDGAPAGEFAVCAIWSEVAKPSENPEEWIDRDRPGGRYSDSRRSGIRATVEAGKNELPPFELK